MQAQKINLSEKAKQDYILVKMALDGDENAFNRLLSRYKDAIYFMLLKMVNNRSDAEDLTLEAFGKAFKIPIIIRMDLPNPEPSSSNCDVLNRWK